MQYEWWHEAVIYQIYPRSFMDSNGDGIGDLAGIASKLDYLAGPLGIDAVWISPFYTSPMADFGYDVADYTDVDPIFGSLDDFDLLVARAHGLGLRVIVDWVPNHSSYLHPWFMESRSSRNNPKRDWYVWRDPAADGSEPNNWISVFSGPAWTYDEHTGQYYLHSFLASQPDVNWRNPETKEAMLDTLRFWLGRGVDGFRLDACHFAMKDPEYRSNPVLERPEHGYKNLGEYDRLVHLYDRGHPDIHGLFREVRAVLDEFSLDRRGSRSARSTWRATSGPAYYGDGDELHMPYHFGMLHGGVDRRLGPKHRRVPGERPAAGRVAQLRPRQSRRGPHRYPLRRATGPYGHHDAPHPAGDADPLLRRRVGHAPGGHTAGRAAGPLGPPPTGIGTGRMPHSHAMDCGARQRFHNRPAVAGDGGSRRRPERGGAVGRPGLDAQPHPAPARGPQECSTALRRGSYETIGGPPDTVFAYRRRAAGETVRVYPELR